MCFCPYYHFSVFPGLILKCFYLKSNITGAHKSGQVLCSHCPCHFVAFWMTHTGASLCHFLFVTWMPELLFDSGCTGLPLWEWALTLKPNTIQMHHITLGRSSVSVWDNEKRNFGCIYNVFITFHCFCYKKPQIMISIKLNLDFA